MDDQIQKIVKNFCLAPHPEGGFYREVYRSELMITHPGIPDNQGQARGRGEFRGRGRCAGTHIYFLLPAGDFSAFHRVVCSDELWHVYAGNPLELHLIHPDGRYELRTLTNDLFHGEPTTMVEAGCWQAARISPGGKWAFGGCTVAPGFEFADFEMPSAQELARLYPQHETIIQHLTKHPPGSNPPEVAPGDIPLAPPI